MSQIDSVIADLLDLPKCPQCHKDISEEIGEVRIASVDNFKFKAVWITCKKCNSLFEAELYESRRTNKKRKH